MPQFAPSESKIAIAPIKMKPSGLACEAELFLGPNETTKTATSGRIPFTSTGASQQVRLPITMPTVEDTYHAYIDAFAEGVHTLAYQAIEDVTIAERKLAYLIDYQLSPEELSAGPKVIITGSVWLPSSAEFPVKNWTIYFYYWVKPPIWWVTEGQREINRQYWTPPMLSYTGAYTFRVPLSTSGALPYWKAAPGIYTIYSFGYYVTLDDIQHNVWEELDTGLRLTIV